MNKENVVIGSTDLSNRIANLSEEKRALLLERLKKRPMQQRNKISRRNAGLDAIPLSFAQERLWFLTQLDPQITAYNEAGALQLSGKLNIALLERALQKIIKRHEILRTVFLAKDAIPYQHVLPEVNLHLERMDFSFVPYEQKTQTIQNYLVDEVKKSFDLASGPLIRFSLIQLDAEKHILLLCVHHIIADNWSINILIQELTAIYNTSLTDDLLCPLLELPIQYADYACWQRAWISGDVLEKELAYWKNQLEGSVSLLELPIDFPRNQAINNAGSKYRFFLDQNKTAQLNQFSRDHEATLFMTLAAAYAVLLSRYTHQHDICIGYPIANRSYAELHELIGFFANTLVLRVRLDDNPTFAKLLARTKLSCVEAQQHQNLPFEKLVGELSPQRIPNRNPLFQIFFNQTVAEAVQQMSGLDLEEMEINNSSAKFDMTLDIRVGDGGLSGYFEYNASLFKESTIARWANHFQCLLQNLLNAPDMPISEITHLLENEHQQLVFHWNATEKIFIQEKCLHQWIEEQVEKYPEAIAMCFEDQQLTYQELNNKANQLAHYLRAQRVASEGLVGVFMERSMDMIVAILAVLKAGGAYVPIDPRYPAEHIASVFQDAQLKIILTQQSLQHLLPLRAAAFCIDTQWKQIEQHSTDNPVNATCIQNLAYVIYTSGSTGHPKGVAVTHSNVIHSTAARLHYYQTPVASFLLLSSIAFDSSIAGIFGTLCQGGRLVLVSEETVLDPAAIINLVTTESISHFLTVPSLYFAILQHLPDELKNSLKAVIVAGEACTNNLVSFHHAKLPEVLLFNEYGPTEATVWSSVHHCRLNEDPIPIGRPTANTQLYLLDSYLNPVPVGIVGEIYIGGKGLVRGYLNHVAMTAQSYIPDLFREPGSRLYRTGDLARYREDGCIDYVGRRDQQVKIRGFRIELGEIESILLQHAAITNVAVIVREDKPDQKHLVAYIVADSSTLEVSEIGVFLKERLADHMVPSIFVLLDQLPVTSNGKIDRKALPAPNIASQITRQYIAPRTETEKIVVAIWQEVLGIEQIGIHDNFFELGGHSLLVAQIVSRINKEVLVNLNLKTVFEAVTIYELSVVIELAKGSQDFVFSNAETKNLEYEDIAI